MLKSNKLANSKRVATYLGAVIVDHEIIILNWNIQEMKTATLYTHRISRNTDLIVYIYMFGHLIDVKANFLSTLNIFL